MNRPFTRESRIKPKAPVYYVFLGCGILSLLVRILSFSPTSSTCLISGLSSPRTCTGGRLGFSTAKKLELWKDSSSCREESTFQSETGESEMQIIAELYNVWIWRIALRKPLWDSGYSCLSSRN
jgi:hypothetical protein